MMPEDSEGEAGVRGDDTVCCGSLSETEGGGDGAQSLMAAMVLNLRRSLDERSSAISLSIH